MQARSGSLRLLAFAGVLCAAAAAQAQDTRQGLDAAPGDPLQLLAQSAGTAGPFEAEPLADAQLGGLRGGFTLEDAGVLGFAVDMFGTIDGTPVLDANVTWDGSTLTTDIAPLGDSRGSFTMNGKSNFNGMIANGPGNFRPDALGGSAMVSVIQNTQSGVAIRHSSSMMLQLAPGTMQAARDARSRFRVGIP